jgi:hypothetical protein
MLIEKSGEINKDINSVLLNNGDMIELGENQFFQITPTGKRLELWEGKNEYFENDNGAGMRRVCYWNCNKSVIAFYKVS